MPRSKKSSIVSRQAFVELLFEHFDAGDDCLSGFAEADDFDFFSYFHFAAFDTAGDHRAASGDRENIFNRHQERLIEFAHWLRNVFVDRFHQLVERLLPLGFAIQRAQRGKSDHRKIVAGKLIRLQQLAHFEFDQIEQFGIVHRIALVQRNDDVRNADLPRSSTCSRVCGIGPSVAATTRMPPSICAAPVIMFLM